MSSLLTRVFVAGLFDAVLRSTAVVLLAIVVIALLGRASAAWRHLVWCLSVASLLLLPVLSLVLPDWRVAWLPQWTAQPTRLAETKHADLARANLPQPLDDAAPLDDTAIVWPASATASATESHKMPHHLPPATSATTNPPRLALPWLAIAWAAGGLLALVPLVIGLWRLAGLNRRSQIILDRRWLTLLDQLRRQLAVRRRVQLRQSESSLAPLTWGALRPVLLVPLESGDWPDKRRRLVLLHELAHVRRWDWLTQLVAHVACAAYWFNPLVWWVARQMRIERERACDDIVLASGARASDYARELLALAAGLSRSRAPMLAALPMARRVALDDRLRGILDSRRNRAALSRAAVCLGAALTAAGVVPLAMLRAAPAEATESEIAEPEKDPPLGRVKTLEMTVDPIIDPDARELEKWPRSRNRIPEGDMESLPRVWKAGWRLLQHSQPGVVCAGDLSADHRHAGKASFHMSVKSRDEETSSPMIETAPLWLRSPALHVEAEQWVRIHGWVNIPQPITGSLDGLLITESLGRKPLAKRIGVSNGWRDFTLYRATTAACDLTVTFALTGVGEVWIDDVTVELISPPKYGVTAGAQQLKEVDDDGPPDEPGPPAAINKPEVKDVWEVTLEEAVQSALENSKTLRNLGGVLFTPAVLPSNRSSPQDRKGAARDPKATGGTKVKLVLARTRDDLALADFEAGVRAILSDVERAYWDLYFNYRNLSAMQAARDSALATWRKFHPLREQNAEGAETEKETQAREQYFMFRAQVENTLGLLYTAESRLRYMMGLVPSDGRLIRPADEPTTEMVRFDWEEVLSEGRDRSVELRRQRDLIKQGERKLADARQAMSGVQDAEATLAKSKAALQDQEMELAHVLTNCIRDLDRNYQVSRTTFNRRVAAQAQVEAAQSAYDAGRATLDMLLDAHRRLADAEIAYNRALVDYNVAILQIHYRKNSLLEYNGILLTEETLSEPRP